MVTKPLVTSDVTSPVTTGGVTLVLPYPISGACIDGPGERTRLGYVRVWRGETRALVHRVAWEQVHGPVPLGMELDHLCRNRWCRNPDHLEVVSHRLNSQRAANRKLTQQKAEEIRSKYVPRVVTQRHLAAAYGVSRRTIEMVLKRVFYP